MRRSHSTTRFALVLALALLTLSASACYKNAGENVQPTSNRVDLSDLQTPTVAATEGPVPVGTGDADVTQEAADPEAQPGGTQEADEPEGQVNVLGPTPTQLDLFGPSEGAGEAEAPTDTPAAPGIATPGMSDIRPTATPTPTTDPARIGPGTPGAGEVQAAVDNCIHIVRAGDSLFSIAQQNGVELADLVAANTDLLTAGENTTLQLDWELRLPGCGDPTPLPAAPAAQTAPPGGAPGIATTAPLAPAAPGGPTTHVVAAGDTVFSIARQYGVSVEAIVQANGLTVQGNVAYITVGQELIIPAPQ